MVDQENQIIEWIFHQTKTKLSKPICESLKNGVVLCKLINIIKPNTIKKINMGTAIFSYRENLTNFIKGCETIGMTEDMSRFQDLIFEDKESTVIQLLYSLMKYSEKMMTTSTTSTTGSPSVSPSTSPSSQNSTTGKPSPVIVKRVITPSTSPNTTTTTVLVESRPHSESIAKPILTALSSSSPIFSTASTPTSTNTVPYKFIGHNKSRIFGQPAADPLQLVQQPTQQQSQSPKDKDEESIPAQPVISPRKKPAAANPIKKLSPQNTSSNSLLSNVPAPPATPTPTPTIISHSKSTSTTVPLTKPTTVKPPSPIPTLQQETEKQYSNSPPENNNKQQSTPTTITTIVEEEPKVASSPSPKSRPPLPSRDGRAQFIESTSTSTEEIQFEMEHASISEGAPTPIENDHDNADGGVSSRSNSANSSDGCNNNNNQQQQQHSSTLPTSVKNKFDNSNTPTTYNTISTSTPSNQNTTTILPTSNQSSIFSPPSSSTPSHYHQSTSPPTITQLSTSPPATQSTSPPISQYNTVSYSSNSSNSNGSPNGHIKKPRSSTKQKLEKFFSKSKLTSSTTNLYGSNNTTNTNNNNNNNNNNTYSNNTNNNGTSTNTTKPVTNSSTSTSSPNSSTNNLLSTSTSTFKNTNNNNSNSNTIKSVNSGSNSKKNRKDLHSPDLNNSINTIGNNGNGHGYDEDESTLALSNQSSNSLGGSGNHFENHNNQHHDDYNNGEPEILVNSEDLMKALSQVEFLFKDRKVLKDRINFVYPEKYKSFVEYDELLQLDGSVTFLTESLLSKKPQRQYEICRQEERRFLGDIFTLQNVLNVVEENKLLTTRTEEMQKMIDSLMLEKKSLSAHIDTLSLKNKQSSEPPRKMHDDGITYNYNNGKYEIKGGTTEKLIELLYNSEFIGSDYFETFLLTYRSFASPKRIMDVLSKTYNENYSLESSGNGGEPLELAKRLEIDQENKQRKETHLKICNFLKRWAEKHFYDFDQDLLQEFNTFIENCRDHQKYLQLTLDKKLNAHTKKTSDPIEYKFNTTPPAPILPKLPITCFEDMEPAEIARQLTIIEFNLFKNIANKEFLSLSWQKQDKEKRSPNLLKMIYRFNEVSNWVTSTIVKETGNIKKRASYLKRFIRLAEELHKLNNFNGVFVIVSGLHSASVNRLKGTWSEIPKQQQKQFEEFVALTSPNSSFAAYRLELRQSTGACIPYLGVHLSDLTFVEEGNQDKLENGYTNFFKCRLIAEQIKAIQEFQQQPYNLLSVSEMLPFLSHKVVPESECFNLSLICEPRESIAN